MKNYKALLAASALCLCGSQANAVVISVTNSTPGYFDASSGTRALTFTPAQAGGTITNVTISIQFGKHDGQTFGVNPGGTPFYNEIEFSLIGNTGGPALTANLISAGSFNTGSDGFLDRTITFDESAGSVVNVNPDDPAAGTFRTTGFAGGLGLNQFFGSTLAAGDWTLVIRDTVFADGLDFHSATLNITVDGVSTPDAGSTFALLSLAIVGLGALRRRFTS